ncbi:VOC family protein [Aquihabitans sp. G128]|uniref:VOC family protein n=1 Tax=Aquihabitans sp. G128 TaxID=2849779 RepID=UPI001C244E48|nr:VOC family protein [Aquihabitans sp. G128]QXC61461.1 VOC family protein [Aquihabitans sp. G128]
MQPQGVHHVSINVADAEASIAFYRDVLGFGVRPDRPDFGFGGAWLDVGGQQVHLIEAPTPQDLGQHFAIEVADIEAAIADLRAKGVDVSDAKPVGTGLQAFFADPSGNALELNQPGGAA